MKYFFISIALVTFIAVQVSSTEIEYQFIKKINLKYSFQYLKSVAEKVVEKVSVSDQCRSELFSLIKDASKLKLWALKMLDSSAKLQPGIFQSGTFFHGNLDQCLSIEEDLKHSKIRGKYCHAVILKRPSYNFTQNLYNVFNMKQVLERLGMPPRSAYEQFKALIGVFAICLPKSCSVKSLQIIWDYVQENFEVPFRVEFKEEYCDHKGKPIAPFKIDKYIYMFFGMILVIVILSTIYDLCYKSNHKNAYFLVFSLNANLNRLFTIRHSKDSLTCLNGIKTLSMFWIILGHRLLLNTLTLNINNFYSIVEFKENYWNSIYSAAPLAVDTFFTVTGILIIYVHSLIKSSQISIWQMYFLRYIRFVPAQGAVILFLIGVYKNLGSGPFWPLFAKKAAMCCYKNWFSTIFQATNLFSIDKQCLEQCWYTAVDFQLFILAPLILFNINKNTKITLSAVLLAIISSMISTYNLSIDNNLGAVFHQYNGEYASKIYYSAFHRMPPWLIGFLFGFLIVKSKRIKIKISPILSASMTLISVTFLCLLIFLTGVIASRPYNTFSAALYNTFTRPLWSLYIGTIILCCSLNKYGVINRILSARFFVFCNKLTYSMFLVHIAVMTISEFPRKRVMTYFYNFGLIHDFFGDLVLTFIVSMLLYITFELPVVNLIEIIANRRHNQKKNV